MSIILVTGGVRSGKSAWAEARLAGQEVAYLTPGYPPSADDPDWAARVAAHQTRRPANWTTVETVDLVAALAATKSAVLIDCLGTWVSRLGDRYLIWTEPPELWQEAFDAEVAALAAALRGLSERTVVLVTNEVGWGVIPPTAAGRRFADQLGRVNQAVAAVADDVVLLVAGRALSL